MKHVMTRLFVGNWMSFGATPFSVENLFSLLSGPNGSGKTSICDAFSLIYYAEEFSMLNYTSDKRRHAAGAIHWQTGFGALRPGGTNSYIIMEARDSNGRTYHQGIFMYSAANSNKVDRRVYFQGEGTLESIGALDYDNVNNGRITMSTVFQSREQAFTAFFARRGYPVDTFIRAHFQGMNSITHFRQMNRAILSNSGIGAKSLSDYAKANIFPAASTGESVAKIQEYQRELDRLSLAARQLEEKAVFLEKIISMGRDNIDAINAANSFERALAHINCEHYESEIKDLTAQIENCTKRISISEQTAKELEEKADGLRNERSRLSQMATPIDSLKKELEVKEEQLKIVMLRLEWHRKYIAAKTALVNRLPDPLMIDRVDDVLSEMEQDEEEKKNIHDKDQRACDEVKDRIGALRAALGGEWTGSGPLAEMFRSAAILKNRISEACPDAQPRFLYECIDGVTDPEWQEAVERLLGNDRFGIIVAGKYYRKACGIQHGIRGNKRAVIVLNTQRDAAKAQKGTVPSVISFNDERAEKYVASAYGRYVLCETAEQYGDAEYAIRKNGQTKAPNRSVLHGSDQRITKILGKEAIRREIDQLVIRKDELEAICAASYEDYKQIRTERDELQNLHAGYKSLAEHNDPLAQKDADTLQERIGEIRQQVADFMNSEEEKEKQAEILRLSGLIEGMEKERRVVLLDIAAAKNEMTECTKKRDEDNKRHKDILITVNSLGPLTELDEAVIEKNGWRTMIGPANINQTRQEVTKRLHLSESMMKEAFLAGKDVMASSPDAPMTIENEDQLKWFMNESKRIAEVRMDKSNLQQIERLKDTLKNQFAGMLHSMHQDLIQAKAIRAKFNSFLPRYRIGSCYYRLGPIQIRQNVENARLMELAEKQEAGGEQLTQDDIRYIDHVFTSIEKNAAKGIIIDPFDYRRYITTSMEYRTDEDENKWQNADRTSNNNSAGQQSILRYILKIVVLASQAYTENSLRVCITDEVLQGVDDTNAAFFFESIREMGVQCILSSYDDRFGEVADDAYIFKMMDDGKHVQIVPFGQRNKA